MYISQLFIYPIKSLGGIELTTSDITERGLRYDRRWLLADADYQFITQRQHTQLAFFSTKITANGLTVTNRQNGSTVQVPFVPQTNEIHHVSVWNDTIEAIRVSPKIDAWFSEQLGFSCSLFYQPDHSVRLIDPDYAITGKEQTSFADGYPILIISQESLDELNSKSTEYMEMRRFRPNIVIAGGKPFQEDLLKKFTVGTTILYGVKPCARCVLTTIHPETSVKGVEPLKTLADFRKKGNKILFGLNVVVHQTGKVSVGDEIN